MLMEHAFYEATIGEKWNVCEMKIIRFNPQISLNKILYYILQQIFIYD